MGLLIGAASSSLPQSIEFSGTIGTPSIDYDRMTVDRTAEGSNLGGDTSDATLEMWIRPTSANDNTGSQWVDGNIFVDADSVEEESSPVGGQFGLSVCNDTIRLGVSAVGSETYTQHIGSTTVNDGEWHWIVFCWDASTGGVQLYIDGSREVNTTRTSGNMGWVSGGNAKAQVIEFGGEKNDFESTSLSFFGRISEIRFSNTVRYNAASITVPTSPLSVDANTTGYWGFKEGSGVTVDDESSNANDISIVTGGSPTVPTWDADGPY